MLIIIRFSQFLRLAALWFAAVLPALTWEGDRVGANVFLIPTMGDRVNGAISVQLKLKVFDGQ
jgi:hypothetical protein